MIYDNQWNRYKGKPEEYHSQAIIMDAKDEKPDFNIAARNQYHLFQYQREI